MDKWTKNVICANGRFDMNKTALVTGASSGIGEETVKGLLAAGFIVYAGARRVDRMRSLTSAGARPMSLDVTDDASMITAVETILQDTGRIDVLVNNAGYGSYGALEDVPLDEARRQFDVNVFGLARLTQLMLPTMRAQRSGRIVNVSSIGGKIGEPFGSWYHATKFSVEGLSDSLRMELRQFDIDVIVIQPGAIVSEWNRLARDGLIKYSGDGDYRVSALAYAKFMESADHGRLPSPPAVVAKTIVKAVQARKPKTRYATGGGAKPVLFLRRILSDRAFDSMMLMGARPAKQKMHGGGGSLEKA
jgi:NAD(P)-dependent dehydrogenase (short-subunit alcohol dehydrogenase family)